MMTRDRCSNRVNLVSAISVLAFTFAFAALSPAQARHYHRHGHARHAYAPYTPPYAAMVVDANTGRVLHAVNENEPRHPASITKVMTLYMLFEQLERGKMNLDTQLSVSAHAASMAPTKLGLRPGATITVENAIKAIVTKSANDMAVVLAEAIGGSEDHFAEMMTAKAQALGMTGTHYVNASGLPDNDQITTARDLTILGRSIQERFPRYYAYFSTHEFTYAGRVIRNHNHLLGRVEGMDGIKTGYTTASGFNLLTSVKRGDRRIVSVVLGGRSAGIRDKIMADLIEANITRGATSRLASAAVADVEKTAPPHFEPRKPEPIKEEPETARPEAPKPEASKPMPLALVSPPMEKPRPAVVASAARGSSDDRTATIPDPRRGGTDSSARPAAGGMRWVAGPSAANDKSSRVEIKVAKAESAHEAAKAEPVRPLAARSGVMIQIGAADDQDKAHELLSRAKSTHAALGTATPFTEKVQKGSETLWRARFAGLSETQAESACKTLKHSGFSCFTTKN